MLADNNSTNTYIATVLRLVDYHMPVHEHRQPFLGETWALPSPNLKSDFQSALAKYLKACHLLQDRLFGREKFTSQRLVDSPQIFTTILTGRPRFSPPPSNGIRRSVKMTWSENMAAEVGWRTRATTRLSQCLNGLRGKSKEQTGQKPCIDC